MKVNDLSQALADMENGVYDFTKNGECSNCGACCSNILPISNKEIKTIKMYMRSHKIKEHRHIIPTAIESLDMTCPFRNDEEKKCEIYAVRPAICKAFKCDYPKQQIDTTKEMMHSKYNIVFMRETFFEEGR